MCGSLSLWLSVCVCVFFVCMCDRVCVHKVFRISNATKMLQVHSILQFLGSFSNLAHHQANMNCTNCWFHSQELPAQQRADAANSLVYEANACMRDRLRLRRCYLLFQQQQVSKIQVQLALAKVEILCVQMKHDGGHAPSTPAAAVPTLAKQQLHRHHHQ